MSSMKKHAAAALELNAITSPDQFPKNQKGYSSRERATLVHLCMHKDKAVRLAVANEPLTRDLFIIMMRDQEKDAEVQKALEPRYLSAMSKEDTRKAELDDSRDECKALKAKLADMAKRMKTAQQ